MKNIKHSIKSTTSHFLFHSGLLKYIRINSTPILVYHRIIPKNLMDNIYSLPGIVTSLETFELQLNYLKEHYTLLSLETFLSGEYESKNNIVITFDDGWKDNYQYAYPLLLKYQIPATIYLTTDFISNSKCFWQEQLIFLIRESLRSLSLSELRSQVNSKIILSISAIYQNPKNDKAWSKLIHQQMEQSEKERTNLIETLQHVLNQPEFPLEHHSFMSWDNIREMHHSGIHFGSHSISHRPLTQINSNECDMELKTSKKILEEQIQVPVSDFSYPNGLFNDSVLNKVKQCGYRSSVSTLAGLNPSHFFPYKLKRVNIHEGKTTHQHGEFSKSLFEMKLKGIF